MNRNIFNNKLITEQYEQLHAFFRKHEINAISLLELYNETPFKDRYCFDTATIYRLDTAKQLKKVKRKNISVEILKFDTEETRRKFFAVQSMLMWFSNFVYNKFKDFSNQIYDKEQKASLEKTLENYQNFNGNILPYFSNNVYSFSKYEQRTILENIQNGIKEDLDYQYSLYNSLVNHYSFREISIEVKQCELEQNTEKKKAKFYLLLEHINMFIYQYLYMPETLNGNIEYVDFNSLQKAEPFDKFKELTSKLKKNISEAKKVLADIYENHKSDFRKAAFCQSLFEDSVSMFGASPYMIRKSLEIYPKLPTPLLIKIQTACSTIFHGLEATEILFNIINTFKIGEPEEEIKKLIFIKRELEETKQLYNEIFSSDAGYCSMLNFESFNFDKFSWTYQFKEEWNKEKIRRLEIKSGSIEEEIKKEGDQAAEKLLKLEEQKNISQTNFQIPISEEFECRKKIEELRKQTENLKQEDKQSLKITIDDLEKEVIKLENYAEGKRKEIRKLKSDIEYLQRKIDELKTDWANLRKHIILFLETLADLKIDDLMNQKQKFIAALKCKDRYEEDKYKQTIEKITDRLTELLEEKIKTEEKITFSSYEKKVSNKFPFPILKENSNSNPTESNSNAEESIPLVTLATAEWLYDKYITRKKEQKNFDYCCISLLYYKTLEAILNDFIYKPYIDFIKKDTENETKPHYKQYFSSPKYYISNGDLNSSCSLGSLIYLFLDIDQTGKLREVIKNKYKISDTEIEKLKSFGYIIDKENKEKKHMISEYRNHAAHGDRIISYCEAIASKTHIYPSCSNNCTNCDIETKDLCNIYKNAIRHCSVNDKDNNNCQECHITDFKCLLVELLSILKLC